MYRFGFSVASGYSDEKSYMLSLVPQDEDSRIISLGIERKFDLKGDNFDDIIDYPEKLKASVKQMIEYNNESDVFDYWKSMEEFREVMTASDKVEATFDGQRIFFYDLTHDYSIKDQYESDNTIRNYSVKYICTGVYDEKGNAHIIDIDYIGT